MKYQQPVLRWFGTFVIALVATPTLDAQLPIPTPERQRKAVHQEVPQGVAPTAPIERAPRQIAGGGQVPVTHGRFDSYQVNVDGLGNNILGDAANEPSIAVDPTDHNRIAIGWREFTAVGNLFRQAGYGYTTDGGLTWTFPTVINPGQFGSDPVLESDADGNFYYSSLQTNRNTTACTAGAGNGIFWSVYTYKSFDGGQTWPQDIFSFGGDKQWIAVDKTGGIGHGNVYQINSPNTAAQCVVGRTFMRSLDGGLTWVDSLDIPNNGLAGTIAVAPDGAIYIGAVQSVVGTSTPQVTLARSSNAQDPGQSPVFDLLTTVDIDGGRPASTVVNPAGIVGQTTIATDHSFSPTRGNIYVLCSVERTSVSDPLDVMFARSEDRGLSWSAPVRVNDDTPGNGAHQWFGVMSVAPNGRIDVAWLDTRDDATPSTPTFSQLYYSFSLDGGDTWAPSEPAGPVFNHTLGYPVGQNKLGDYFDMDSDNNGADLAYAATYNGEQDVYYLRLTPDCDGNGIADVDDIAGGATDCNGNGTPDSCEPNLDCNSNTIQDICDVAAGGGSDDCNLNFIPDECEPNLDCNANTVQDICDVVAGGVSEDCNNNDVPDECEPGDDCNANGEIDECDIGPGGASEDCNNNGIPDECDIASGFSTDNDLDGIPDECVGACCQCDSCTELTPSQCNATNGVFSGVGIACIDVTCPTAEPEDDCNTAVVLPNDVQSSAPFDTMLASTDGPTAIGCEAPGTVPPGFDHWYEYTPPCCGTMTVDICDADYDAILAVYGGEQSCACPGSSAASLVLCSDDGCGVASGGTVSIPVDADSCYLIQVAGFTGQGVAATGTGTVNVTMSCLASGTTSDAQITGHWGVDLGTYTDNGSFADLTAEGDVAYLGQLLDNKVHFIDISDPNVPTQMLEWIVGPPNQNASAEDVSTGDGLLFISLFGDGNDGVEIVDVRVPSAPAHLSWINVPGFADVKNTYYDNGYLYLTNATTPDIAVVDLTTYDPDSPPASITTAWWTVTVGTSYLEDVLVQNGVLYAGAGNDGLMIFDVSSIASVAPTLLGAGPVVTGMHTPAVSADGRWVAINQESTGGSLFLYEIVVNGGGVDVLLRQTIAPPATSTSFHKSAWIGNRVYAATMEAGLTILEIDETAAQLSQVDVHPTYYFATFGGFTGAWGVYPFLGEDRVLVSDSSTGLHILNTVEQRLSFSYPDGIPDTIDPTSGTVLTVRADSLCDDVDPSEVSVFVQNSGTGGGFTEFPMSPVGDGSFTALLPADTCGTFTDYYVRAGTLSGAVVFDPPGAPHKTHQALLAGWTNPLFTDSFETGLGWSGNDSQCADGTTIGAWQRLNPNGTLLAPENGAVSAGGGVQCLVTSDGGPGASYFSNDIDGGPYRIESPVIPIDGQDVVVRYQRWYYSVREPNAAAENFLTIEVSGDNGGSWQIVETVASAGAQWVPGAFRLSDFIVPGATLRLRAVASDCVNNGVNEAGLDEVSVAAFGCEPCQPAPPVTALPEPKSRSRYISCTPDPGAEPSALRVVLDQVTGFELFNGETRWVGPPSQFPEEVATNPGQQFWGAPLSCEPHFADWSGIGPLHIFGAEIAPDSTFTVQAVGESCLELLGNETIYAPPISITTGRWGDVVAPYFEPGAVQPNFLDISGVVGKFLGNSGAPIKAAAQLQSNVPNPSLAINFKDIASVVASFLGEEYPYTGPCVCPSSVTCDATPCSIDSNCAGGLCIDNFCRDACGRCSP